MCSVQTIHSCCFRIVCQATSWEAFWLAPKEHKAYSRLELPWQHQSWVEFVEQTFLLFNKQSVWIGTKVLRMCLSIMLYEQLVIIMGTYVPGVENPWICPYSPLEIWHMHARVSSTYMYLGHLNIMYTLLTDVTFFIFIASSVYLIVSLLLLILMVWS